MSHCSLSMLASYQYTGTMTHAVFLLLISIVQLCQVWHCARFFLCLYVCLSEICWY